LKIEKEKPYHSSQSRGEFIKLEPKKYMKEFFNIQEDEEKHTEIVGKLATEILLTKTARKRLFGYSQKLSLGLSLR